MDITDLATDQEERARVQSLAYRKPELAFTGICYNCQLVVEKPAKFCDEFCREDYLIRNSDKA